MGGKIHTIKEKIKSLLATSKEIGLEVIADKTEYMDMFHDQNAGRTQNMRIENRSFERVEQFKYLGTILKAQNSIQEEIKTRLK